MKRIVPPALLLALLVLPSGCVEKRTLVDGLATFQIDVVGDLGTADQPLEFPLQPHPLDVTVKAISNHGLPMTGFSGEVSLFATPGHTQTAAGQLRVRVTLEQGVGTTSLDLAQVYGPTHVCAKDDLRHDDSTYAVGCSPTIFFQMPTVAEVETTNDGSTSPLVNNFLQISRGDLIVTGIGAEGFFVTDIAENPPQQYAGNWASLYIYNYSYPDGLQVGDHLESITGTVQEFTGATQLTFPSWVRKEGPTKLGDVPAPTLLTTAICGAPASGNNALLCGYDTANLDLESLEAALVKVENVRTPSKWVDCDLNQDGNVPNYDPSCTPGGESNDCKEIACKDACNIDPTCSELSSYRVYGQWAVAMNDGVGPKINVLTREGYPEFDPTKEENFGKALDVTGNLRQSLPARPRWIIVVRTAEDVTVRQ